MFNMIKRLGTAALITAGACGTASASSPTGIWLDHTGRAAIEISECGGNLCGRIVWVKDPNDKEGCNMQIIGNVKPVAGGKWDGGWILDPEKNTKYDVELTPMGEKLKVLGYAGSKFLSETMMWTRASPGLPKCDATAAGTPAPAPAPLAERSAPTPPAPPAAAPEPAPEEPRKSAAKGKECKLELPYITLVVPCD